MEDVMICGPQDVPQQQQQQEKQPPQKQVQVECSAAVLQELLTSIEAFEAATAGASSVCIVKTSKEQLSTK